MSKSRNKPLLYSEVHLQLTSRRLRQQCAGSNVALYHNGRRTELLWKVVSSAMIRGRLTILELCKSAKGKVRVLLQVYPTAETAEGPSTTVRTAVQYYLTDI